MNDSAVNEDPLLTTCCDVHLREVRARRGRRATCFPYLGISDSLDCFFTLTSIIIITKQNMPCLCILRHINGDDGDPWIWRTASADQARLCAKSLLQLIFKPILRVRGATQKQWHQMLCIRHITPHRTKDILTALAVELLGGRNSFAFDSKHQREKTSRRSAHNQVE